MPLVKVDLHRPLEPLQWAVQGLLLRGYLNTVASLPGEGKTALLTGIAWQASRPEGGSFLGRQVAPGVTLYVDYDAPGEGRSIRYWLTQHRAAYPDGDLSKVAVVEPDHNTYGLGELELTELTRMTQATGARLLIIDSFMSAFPSTDPVKLAQVQTPLWYLRRLATETDAAVLLVDHLPKPMSGERAGARGILGSIAKPAQARTVHVLTRVPPGDIEGRHVLRWESTKMSYSARPEPFGLELRFVEGRVYIEAATLPDDRTETRTDKAMRLMQDHLETNRGTVVSRQALLRLARVEGKLRDRAAVDALKEVLTRLGGSLVSVTLPGRGQPQGYRVLSETELRLGASLHQTRDVPSGTEKDFAHPPLHQNGSLNFDEET